MSELVVVAFKDRYRAEEVRIDLLKLDREHLVDLEDAVVLVRDKNGKVKLRHASHLTLGGAIGGGFLGMMLGVMLLNPVFAALGLAAGTAIGAVSGSMEHLGIDEDFMKDLAGHLQPGTSALCILVRDHLNLVLEDVQRYGGQVLTSSLKHEDEEQLKAALEQVKASV
jgi:uncharacterized membrane protein